MDINISESMHINLNATIDIKDDKKTYLGTIRKEDSVNLVVTLNEGIKKLYIPDDAEITLQYQIGDLVSNEKIGPGSKIPTGIKIRIPAYLTGTVGKVMMCLNLKDKEGSITTPIFYYKVDNIIQSSNPNISH